MDERQNPNARGPLRITRVTTRMGDGGRTRLADGREVPKSHPRLEAIGTVDELQVAIGAARDALESAAGPIAAQAAAIGDRLRRIAEHLVHLQHLLFTLSGDLATPLESRWAEMPLVRREDIEGLERLIEACNALLPPLEDFVLPGGHPAVTALHGCRVVCRRAERAIERLGEAEPLGETVRPCINRLSDVFFVLARSVGRSLCEAGMIAEESIWRRGRNPPPLP